MSGIEQHELLTEQLTRVVAQQVLMERLEHRGLAHWSFGKKKGGEVKAGSLADPNFQPRPARPINKAVLDSAVMALPGNGPKEDPRVTEGYRRRNETYWRVVDAAIAREAQAAADKIVDKKLEKIMAEIDQHRGDLDELQTTTAELAERYDIEMKKMAQIVYAHLKGWL